MKEQTGGRLKTVNDEYYVSAYSGVLEPIVLIQNMNKLKLSFPKMGDDFFNILSERIVANGFSNARLKDAVNFIIDNFQYKELNVSDIIRFDKRIKLYTYNDVCTMVTKNQASFDDFEIKEIDGKCFRIKKTDL